VRGVAQLRSFLKLCIVLYALCYSIPLLAVWTVLRFVWTIKLGFFRGWAQLDARPLFTLLGVLYLAIFRGRFMHPRRFEQSICEYPILGVVYSILLVVLFFTPLLRDCVLFLTTAFCVYLLDLYYASRRVSLLHRLVMIPVLANICNQLYEAVLFTHVLLSEKCLNFALAFWLVTLYVLLQEFSSVEKSRLFTVGIVLLAYSITYTTLVSILHVYPYTEKIARIVTCVTMRLSPYITLTSLELRQANENLLHKYVKELFKT